MLFQWIKDELPFNRHTSMIYFLAALPILIVLVSMIVFHLGGQYAGPVGLLTGVLVAWLFFGLTPAVLLISQYKGFLLSVFVLAVFLPALLLYTIVNQASGIQALVVALKSLIADRGILLIVIAWAFSGMLEGLAGFGIPVAIISPMLVGLGVPPVMAVASVAVGHAWSVTFGDMGVVFQTLVSVVKVEPARLAMFAAVLLGIACLLCGLAVANLIKRMDLWLVVLLLAGVMASVQYLFAVHSMAALASFFAGLSGVITAILLSRFLSKKTIDPPATAIITKPFKAAALSYGCLSVILVVIATVLPLNKLLGNVTWTVAFPQVKTLLGFITPAIARQTYRPLLHPGTTLLLVAICSYFFNKRNGLYQSTSLQKILSLTWKSSWRAMVGIFSMVGLSALMDHAGMTYQLADLLSKLFQSLYPLVSPFIGMLGAFATGSNNNSNVLFGPLQENIAGILRISPAIIVAAQTTGGSLGSMIAPAKIIVGCSTVDLKNQEGEVLLKTIPYGLIISSILGVVTLILIKVF
jgi:lactate permease